MYQAERIATIHFGNCPARESTAGVGCTCGATTAETDKRQRRCVKCRRPVVNRGCKVCAETQDLIDAIADIEQHIDLVVDESVATGVKKIRTVIAKRIAGPVGWPKS